MFKTFKKPTRLILMLIMASIIIVPALAQGSVDLEVITGTITDTVSFGTASGASDGFDSGLDEVLPPAPPSSSDIRPYFLIDHDYFPKLTTDIRDEDAENIIWKLNFENSGTGIVKWNPSDIPTGSYTLAGLDMHNNNQYDFDASEEINIVYSAPNSMLLNLNIYSAEDTVNLSYGISESATDGFDSGLDEVSPPPAPSQAAVYFTATGIFNSLKKDIRSVGKVSQTWNIKSENGFVGTIEWDSILLPALGSFTIDGVNMRDVESCEIDANETINLVYQKPGIPLTIVSADEEDSVEITFGLNYSATNGFDENIDFICPPAVPNQISAYLKTDYVVPYTTLSTDMRDATSDQIDWTLYFSEGCTVYWDSSDLPVDGTFRFDNIDMRISSEKNYGSGKEITISYYQENYTFNELTVVSGDDSMSVAFGTNISATDQFDAGMDAISPPAVPEGFDVYFSSTQSTPYNRLSTDVRDGGQEYIVWNLVTSGGAGEISWNPEEISNGNFRIGGSVSLNEDSSYSFTDGETVVIELVQVGPSLFFSEYIEGSGQNKALEIYNATTETIDLADYTLKGTHNGDNDWEYCTYQFPTHDLAAGEVYVLATTDADDAIKAVADTLFTYDDNEIVYFNGDDARAIFKGGQLIDVIGVPDEDPGSAWDVAGGLGATGEYTLIRKASILEGNYDWAVSAGIDEETSEWVVMPQNTFNFLGSHPHTDFTFPTIGGSVAEESLIQIRYSEEVNSTNALDVANYSVNGSAPTSVTKINSTVYTLDAGTITPNTDVQVIVTNLVDNIGLKTDADTTICQYLTIDITAAADKYFCEWESDLGPASWWVPTGSGSTYGILGTSTFAMSSDAAYQGTQSAKLDIKDDSARDGGWFVREYNATKDNIAYDSKLYMYVKCDVPDVQIRFVVDDDGSSGDSGYETSRWFDITATGDDWQVISLDLASDPVYGWINGNGAIESTDEVSVSSIQLQCAEDVDAVLYFDILTERPAGTDAVTFNTLPEKFVLHQNYPNPFNPTTHIQFDLPKAMDVKLVIYDITGHKVTTLINTHMDAGYKNIVWNGTNDYGKTISSGIYIYRIIAGNNIETMKMSYIK